MGERLNVGFICISAGSFTMGSPASEAVLDWDETQHQVRMTHDFYLQNTAVTQRAYEALMGSKLNVGFIRISAGSFTMGSPASEAERGPDETQHQVTLTHTFYLQSTEVTQTAYRALMGSNPSYFSDCGGSCPAEQVSWYDAIAYANALSESMGLRACYGTDGTVLGGGSVYDCEGYRLPTEAEWEYAARAGSTRARYGYLSRVAWLWKNSGATTHPVGQLQPNAWGLYDMLGNVSEWTHDWYAEDYGNGNSTVIDPVGASSGVTRVYRGGGWGSDPAGARAAFRANVEPFWRNYTLGFRLARSAR